MVCGILTTVLTGINPVQVYVTIFMGAFGTARKSWITFQNVAILLLISLALTPAFRMRFWNIGGEGQVLIGGLAAAACMICLAGKLPNALIILLMFVTSLAAGAVWGLIPAFFKAKWNTNETLSTLMMNYIATQLVAFFTIVWEVPKGSGKDRYHQPEDEYRLAAEPVRLQISADDSYRSGYDDPSMYIYFVYSKHGYEIAVVGESENTARYVGIKVEKVIMRTMVLSGAVCGTGRTSSGRRNQPYSYDHHCRTVRDLRLLWYPGWQNLIRFTMAFYQFPDYIL